MRRASKLALAAFTVCLTLTALSFTAPAQATNDIAGISQASNNIDGIAKATHSNDTHTALVQRGDNGIDESGHEHFGAVGRAGAEKWHWNKWKGLTRVCPLEPLPGEDPCENWKESTYWDTGCTGTDCGEHDEGGYLNVVSDSIQFLTFGPQTWLGHHTHTSCEPAATHAAIQQTATEHTHSLTQHAQADSSLPDYCAHTHPEPEDEPVCTPAQRILIDIHKGGSLSTPAERDAHVGNHLYPNPDCPTHTHCIREPAHNAVEQNADQMAAHDLDNMHGSKSRSRVFFTNVSVMVHGL